MNENHWAVFITNTSNKGDLIDNLLNECTLQGFEELKGLQGALFSKLALERFMDEEERHGAKIITSETPQSLRTMSSGEQKKALLKHIIQGKPDFMVLDNPFDNLDSESQQTLKKQLVRIAKITPIVQLISRRSDLLPFVTRFAQLENTALEFYDQLDQMMVSQNAAPLSSSIPLPLHKVDFEQDILLELKNVTIQYSGKTILKNINWKIKKGDFWELRGKNGSGKTTILSMITGENPKGYGQELYIFGLRKGTGESVWDIKKRIGYFTPSMTDKFTGYHSVEFMIISGLTDSIGLYTRPTESQLRVAKEWLLLLGMWHLKNELYHDLSMGQKRLLMCARAMIKHPVLLIFDEPTAGLDDESALLFVTLVNKFAAESETAIVFVSHRKEPDLTPDRIYELKLTNEGSLGTIIN